MDINSGGSSLTTGSINLQAAAGDFVLGQLTATHGGIDLETGGNITTGDLAAQDVTTDSSAANADVVIFAGGSISTGAIASSARVLSGIADCVSGCGTASAKVDLHSNSSFSAGATALSTHAITTQAVSGDADANASVTLTHHFTPSGVATGTIDTGRILTSATSNATPDGSVHLVNETIGRINTGGASITATGYDVSGAAVMGAGDIELETGKDNITTGALIATNSSISVTDGNFGGANHAADTQVRLGALSGGFDAQDNPYELHTVNLLSGGSLALDTSAGLIADDISLGAGDGDFSAGLLQATAGQVVLEARNGNITLTAAPLAAGCGNSSGCVFIDTDHTMLIDTGNAPLVLDQVNMGTSSVFTSIIQLRSTAGITVSNSHLNGGVIDIQGPQDVSVTGSLLTSECQVPSNCLHLVAGNDLLLQNTSVADISQIGLSAGRDLIFDHATLGYSNGTPLAWYYSTAASAGRDVLLRNRSSLSNAIVLLEAGRNVVDDGSGQASFINSNSLGIGASGNIDLASTVITVSNGVAPIGGDPELVTLEQSQTDGID
ncbi:MAG TPA: hypothetical protein VHE37_16915, partial [Nevskiaceae bacterium]|nr:hypothetical protein [Nevskiaceae bacterium]